MRGALRRLRERLHRRKRNRDRKHRKHQGRLAMREARAVQHLRALIDHLRKEPRVMFDDTTVSLIPFTARAVAGYVNGAYRTIGPLLLRFPRSRVVTIAVNSLGRAQFLDIERGNATIADAPDWWRHTSQARGPYIPESDAAELVAHLEAHGIHRHEYVLWTAHYNGERHICAPETCGCAVRADGTQWTDRANSRSLDESWLHLSFWRRLPHD
jgi:hypothetical protein